MKDGKTRDLEVERDVAIAAETADGFGDRARAESRHETIRTVWLERQHHESAPARDAKLLELELFRRLPTLRRPAIRREYL
jgi:hypothetical protein